MPSNSSPSPIFEPSGCLPDLLGLLDVKPGITDFATIWNPDEGTLLAGEADPDKAYLEKVRPQKLRLQLKYVRERGFWTDLRILGNTAWIVARKFLPF